MTHPNPARRPFRPLLLDLYACAGAIGTGYHRAGFDVHGVDMVDRPNNPFPLTVADALEHLTRLIESDDIARYSFVHASPPCQDKCALTVGTNRSRGWGGVHTTWWPPPGSCSNGPACRT